MARGGPDGAPVEQRQLDGAGVLLRALPGVDREADERIPVPFGLDDVERVQGRGAGAGVELGLDPAHVRVGERHPFAPPGDGA